MSELRHAETWNGRHRDISIQIRRHTAGGGASGREYPVWCYYLYITEQQVPEELRAGFFVSPVVKPLSVGGREYVTYDYYSSAFANLQSWHGGLTYYDYERTVPGHRCVKVGCDWNHLWDNAEEDPFDLRSVEYECRATADELREMYPGLLYQCGWMGTFHPLSDLEPWKGGHISAEGARKRDEHKAGSRA